ncbi:hypothetical protein FACS189425_10280 [Clostridia bacterium]|nr:hypothetical protein FACS189425_10280 [Clostridia bacterium]
MHKVKFPVAPGIFAALSFTQNVTDNVPMRIIDNTFNDVIAGLIENGTADMIMDSRISWNITKKQDHRGAIRLRDDVYAQLEDFREKYGDFNCERFKEFVSVMVNNGFNKSVALAQTGDIPVIGD